MDTYQDSTTHTPNGAASVLTTEDVQRVLAEAEAFIRPASPYLQLLRWLIWLPLLSARELARVMRKGEQTVWGYLARLEQCELAAHIVLSEPDWPRHRRYYITDLGLYALAACYPHPLSVPKLAASYAIEQRDLLARLARPQVHLVLSDLVSRLLSELPESYQLTSYQQPWRQAYRWQGKQRIFEADAALLLQTPAGREHALYVRVDQPERMFGQRQEQAYLAKLFELRQATHLQQDVMPHLLLLSTPARFAFWAEQLERSALARGSAVLAGAIADYDQVQAALRFLAVRHGVSPAHYLYPVTEELDRRTISTLDPALPWAQRGIKGLRAQMSHTHELYRCIRHIVAAGRRSGSYAIVLWKSARESVRSYHDMGESYSIRPDAEVLYTLPGSTVVRHVLIEYDRGTTFAREYQDKFAAYAAYQHDMHTVLPRIVMITPNQQAAERIGRSIRQAHAQDVQVTIILEQDVLQCGLLPVLGVQGSPQGSEKT